MKKLVLALAQINPTVGDFEGNSEKIISYMKEARKYGAEVVAFPELAVTGYPPEDLLLKPQFISDNLRALNTVRENATGIVAAVGFVDRRQDIYNAAAIISEKRIVDIYHKHYLPNYGPFDEFRYFQAGTRYPVYKIGDVGLGVNICEDIWYPEGPHAVQALSGAEVIININASPYTVGKGDLRESRLVTRATDCASVIAYLNTVGGQDELVFDGGSIIADERGSIIARGKLFEEDLVVCEIDVESVFMHRLQFPLRRQQALGLEEAHIETVHVPRKKTEPKARPPKPGYRPMGFEEEIYSALVLGVSDYVGKNGFKGTVIGLSGGVDSALVAALAVDALGAKNVSCLFLPSRYTSEESREDARALCRNLGVKLTEIPIDGVFESYLETLRPHFKRRKSDSTEQNIQARIRGNIIMAFSNKFGRMVLTTGNKSEMSVGYATLYGDMAGGFAAIKDVPKTMVYALAQWRNRRGKKPVIPERVFWKEPSAELAPGQKDSDDLPPYEVLDPVLKAYVEEERSFEEILQLDCAPQCAKDVIRMIDRSEYKRRQAPPGIKLTGRAFGKDRRFPITNRYRSY
ncbi:MAG: NAD+ synthase [Nitrospirota bacterium]|jgi:NAD+ synthase (glutamine-hydrolysing)